MRKIQNGERFRGLGDNVVTVLSGADVPSISICGQAYLNELLDVVEPCLVELLAAEVPMLVTTKHTDYSKAQCERSGTGFVLGMGGVLKSIYKSPTTWTLSTLKQNVSNGDIVFVVSDSLVPHWNCAVFIIAANTDNGDRITEDFSANEFLTMLVIKLNEE